MTRPFTDADRLAIKAATKAACEDTGSLKSISLSTRVSYVALSHYGNPERPEFAPIDIAMDLDALSGGDRILRAWAELRGYQLVRDEKGIAVEDMNRHIGAVGMASGSVINEMCAAISDKVVTPNEAKAIASEAEQLQENLRLLAGDCRRIMAKEVVA